MANLVKPSDFAVGSNPVRIPVFPLRASLFWPFEGRIESTWDFFSRTWPESKREACAKWQTDNCLNALVFLTHNLDPRNPVSFFRGPYGADGVDGAQLTILERWLQRGKDASAVMVPTLLSDHILDGKKYPDEEEGTDYAKTGYDKLFAKRAVYFDLALPFLEKYCPAVLIGLESTEWATMVEHGVMTAFMRQRTKMKIGSHIQWRWDTSFPAFGLDFYLHEHSWPPDQGSGKSVEEVTGEARNVLARSPVSVGFLEYTLKTWEARGREQTRALANLPGVLLVGGTT